MASIDLPPVLALSHGTPMLTGEKSHIRDYWRRQGDKALEYGVKGVIIVVCIDIAHDMENFRNRKLTRQLEQGAHWNAEGRKVKIATNPSPQKEKLGYVKNSEYSDFKPHPDLKTAERCLQMLQAAGFEVEADPKFNWLIDTFPMLLRMFPDRCPPVTIISQNSHYDPYFHVEIGRTLRPLRKEGYLFIGSGGGVHNLYRVDWSGMLLWRDNWAQRAPPSGPHLEFRQALEDVICKNGGGPDLKRAIVRLIKHPYYRVAHGTDEHFLPFCFVAGLVGEEEDRGEKGVLACEVWELGQQAETQFSIGDWPCRSYVAPL
ncbi:catalytic LigB subunit of aromatic ring-opening dioxygenase [Exophiala viscosa]|uniref:Catalytic LigB subunit of aromatic ring-opening dioxygenase n=1 Tax=Exophiala viscosa TaxID=2486360 RepID=A0AAN6E3A4_9EURO|nr:catalytic LigB subunit of aromatic ring-opening dioxygenase [Exophiala viscosa]